MAEIYWITRLDAINTLFTIMLFAAGITALCTLIGMLCDPPEDVKNTVTKSFKWSSIAFCIFAFLAVFIPTTKDMYTIYGVGGTIDYIKSDSVAKQLPHKCIVALDKWLETQTEQFNK